MILLELLWSFLQIGLLSIGGGYATIPLIQSQVVNLHKWLTYQEFTDIITISQMTPGPIAVNTSTFVGLRIAGLLGAIVATLGCIFFGFVISLTLYRIFQKYHEQKSTLFILQGLKASSIGLIGSAGATLLISCFYQPQSPLWIDIRAVAIFVIAWVVLKKYKLSPMMIMVLTGGLGILFYGFIS